MSAAANCPSFSPVARRFAARPPGTLCGQYGSGGDAPCSVGLYQDEFTVGRDGCHTTDEAGFVFFLGLLCGFLFGLVCTCGNEGDAQHERQGPVGFGERYES